jgi:hypothetical protein
MRDGSVLSAARSFAFINLDAFPARSPGVNHGIVPAIKAQRADKSPGRHFITISDFLISFQNEEHHPRCAAEEASALPLLRFWHMLPPVITAFIKKKIRMRVRPE